MTRVHNFCAGPCTLPVSVLEQLSNDMVDFQGSGMSLIEMSHRAKIYDEIHHGAMDSLRRLYHAPDDVDVLLLQGGASLQFAMAPMNVLHDGDKAGYIVSGTWGKKAHEDAALIGDTYVAWSGADANFTRMPDPAEVRVEDNTRYLHITSNETIGGIRLNGFHDYGVRQIADMSSDYLSRPIPWDLFDVVYGGAQKNLGPAGLTVVFVRKSVLEQCRTDRPSYLRYDLHAKADSLANTPPVFAIWATGLMLGWMEEHGGVEGMQARASLRSSMIYDAIDASEGFYNSPVRGSDRSHMNIVFTLANPELEGEFFARAAEQGLENLKGHRSVGGARASVYNALPTESVTTLIDFMAAFAATRG
jgi:phosphoserine aminotransferase